ncbi:hypothetical protein [Viridibacillus arvi]
MKKGTCKRDKVIGRDVLQKQMFDITLYENSKYLSTVWMKNGEVIEEPTQ